MQLVDAKTVAAMLSCSVDLVYLLSRQGHLKSVLIGTGLVRPRRVYDLRDVEDFVREGRARAEAVTA
jgi:hypothetical protein